MKRSLLLKPGVFIVFEGQQPVGSQKFIPQGQAGKKHENDKKRSSDHEDTKGSFNSRKRSKLYIVLDKVMRALLKSTRNP